MIGFSSRGRERRGSARCMEGHWRLQLPKPWGWVCWEGVLRGGGTAAVRGRPGGTGQAEGGEARWGGESRCQARGKSGRRLFLPLASKVGTTVKFSPGYTVGRSCPQRCPLDLDPARCSFCFSNEVPVPFAGRARHERLENNQGQRAAVTELHS